MASANPKGMDWKKIALVLLMVCPLASADPLMTVEYPVWVQDAVRALRSQGIISAGTLPQQAITRNDMWPVLRRFMELQEKEDEGLARKQDLQEVRSLLESLLEEAARQNQRVDQIHPPDVKE